MNTKSGLFGMLFLLLAGCGGNGLIFAKPDVDVEIVNQSTQLLENAQTHFGVYTCKWGFVIKNGNANYLFYPHPITPEAELHWDEAGGHRMQKIDLRRVYPPGKSGQLTFTVYDDRVEATFRERP